MVRAASFSSSRRLLVGMIVVGVLTIGNLSLFGWLILRSLSERELTEIMSQTRAEAEELAGQLEGEVEKGGDDLLSAIVRRQETQTYIDEVLSKRETVATVRILDENGAILFESINRTTAERPGAFDGVDTPTVDVRRVSETPYEVVEAPIGNVGVFVVGISQTEMERRVRVLRSELLRRAVPIGVVTLLLLLSVYLFILWLTRRGSRLETRAREAEQMAYIGTLASGLAPEIRSPLNSLNLNMQMLEEDLVGGGEGTRHRLLSITRSEITRLENLVTDFLSYARPRRLQLEEVRAVDLLDHVREVTAAQMSAAGVELVVDDRTAGDHVEVDIGLMNQLLLNLVQNSVQALEEKGEGGRVVLTVERRGAALMLSVEDSGVGMDRELQERALDLFFSTRKGGTGLGLAICQRIARFHGSVLTIESEPGAGTKVGLDLPAVRRPTPVKARLPLSQGVSEG